MTSRGWQSKSRGMEMAFAAVLLGVTLPICAAEYSWQQPHAKVIPSGDLEWAPRPYRLAVEPGATFRYLDFERGDDRQDGKTPETAWKHHPLDPQATGAARNGLGAYTYLFKGGVEYRGTLRGRLEGTAEQPIRLAWDPNWGAVPPVLLGSESVSGWIRGADRPDIRRATKSGGRICLSRHVVFGWWMPPAKSNVYAWRARRTGGSATPMM